jgi:quercetin dioxygenase-like cupin family protein
MAGEPFRCVHSTGRRYTQTAGLNGRPPASSEPAHVEIASLALYAFGEHRFRFILTGAQTGGSYSVMQTVSPVNTGPGAHVHPDAEEHSHVLEGDVEFYLDGLGMTARPGDIVHIPRGAVHDFTVLSDSATMMATFTPAGEEQGLLDGSVPGLSE